MRSNRAHSLTAFILAATVMGCTPGSSPDESAGSAEPAPQQACHGDAGAGDPYYPQDGNGGYDALDYDVSISYDPDEQQLEGDSTITATAEHDLCRFNLDLRGLEVDSVEVNGEPAELNRHGEFELVITPAATINEGQQFTARVRYEGEPTSSSHRLIGGLGWQTSDSGGSFNIGEPHSAAFWYPVNETPRDKATFRLSARVPEDWVAVSIGTYEGSTTDDGWTTYTWVEENPVASYLTTVAVDKFTLDESELSDGTPVLSAYAAGAEDRRELEQMMPQVVDVLSDLFGEYPQSAAGGIYLNTEIGYALETQGRPTYSTWGDERLLVHEYAHQWFGNSVTLTSWSDLCLNECFASYTEWLWAERQNGQDSDARYENALANVVDSEGFWRNKLHEMGAGNEFNGVYDKGALAMHALRVEVGDEVFFDALRGWAERHRHSNASWPEFERFVQDKAGTDLGDFFDAWFRGDEIPDDEFLCPGHLRCP